MVIIIRYCIVIGAWKGRISVQIYEPDFFLFDVSSLIIID